MFGRCVCYSIQSLLINCGRLTHTHSHTNIYCAQHCVKENSIVENHAAINVKQGERQSNTKRIRAHSYTHTQSESLWSRSARETMRETNCFYDRCCELVEGMNETAENKRTSEHVLPYINCLKFTRLTTNSASVYRVQNVHVFVCMCKRRREQDRN